MEVAGEQLIQDHAERIDVRLHRKWLTLEGFGCRVGRRGGIPAGRSNGVREAEARDTESVDVVGVEHVSAAEVRERDVDGLAGRRFHKNIRWFQVLMEHAHRVQGGEDSGDFCDHSQALGERDRCDAAATFGPFGDAPAAHVLRLREIGRFFQVPVEQSNDLGALAEGVVENAKKRDLALERRERGLIEGELEHSLLVGLLMARAPRLALFGEPLDQGPERPGRRVVARVEVKGCGLPRRGQFHLDGGDEAIAEAIDGFYDVLLAVADGLAQPADALGQYGFAQDPPGPYRGEQFILGAHLAGMLQQVDQNLEGLALELGVNPVDEQLQGGLIDHRRAKAPTATAALGRRSDYRAWLVSHSPYVLVA